MKIGLATNGFNNLTNDEMAQLCADNKLDCVQLFLCQKDSNYWRYNGRHSPEKLTTAECQRIANAYRSRGIGIPSIGIYTNLIEPNEAERAQNIQHFAEMMRVANDMGIHILATECGSVIVPGKGRDLSASLSEDAYPRLMDSTRKLVDLAAKHDVIIVFEPYFQDLLGSATALRYFIEEVNSPRVRAQLDPANLLAHNTLEEMFAALAPYIAMLHAKDRKLHVTRGVAAGEGDVDYARFVSLCRQYCAHVPLIIEYVNPNTYKAALNHLRLHL
jgi:sugar phosphate isomerase/epimerase